MHPFKTDTDCSRVEALKARYLQSWLFLFCLKLRPLFYQHVLHSVPELELHFWIWVLHRRQTTSSQKINGQTPALEQPWDTYSVTSLQLYVIPWAKSFCRFFKESFVQVLKGTQNKVCWECGIKWYVEWNENKEKSEYCEKQCGWGGSPQVILSDKNNSQALHFRGGEPWHFNAGKNTDKRKYTSSF